MPKVTFTYDRVTVDVKAGTSLQDIVDTHNLTLSFGCRGGTCGTCRCVVSSGIENLNPMTELENEMFESFTSVGINERLACQVIVNGDATIEV